MGNVPTGETPSYDDSSWRLLSLPHDWSVESLKNQVPGTTIGPFSKESLGGAATGQTLGGEGWYRKTFTLSAAEAGKRHELYFEGVYNQCDIWVNGQKTYRNVYGYTTFRFDISPYCKAPGQKNVVAIKVVNEGRNSRWYSGSGIYRHVWLLHTPPSHLDDWGTFIDTRTIDQQQAGMALSIPVVNREKTAAAYTVAVELLSPDGKRVATATHNATVAVYDSLAIPLALTVPAPQLWSPETPRLYVARIRLQKGKKEIDELRVPFGIRTLAFSAARGFELNGVALELKGGCLHHDNGLLGAAAFDRAEERKLELLKQNGYNAVRVSHNPMSESFMAACDRLGMLVVDEAFDQWQEPKNLQDYHLYFQDWSAKDIRALVLRDRNHPSVIMWSIGNEIRERLSDQGVEIAGYLKKEILRYDTTRPVTAGVNKQWDKDHQNMLPLDQAFTHLDVAGYNYMWRFYEQEHAKFPQRILFGSESVATEAAQNWNKVEQYPYVIGDFVWTALDYLGESGIGNSIEVNPQENVHQFMGWPWFNGWCGDLDILGTKKPQSYYRDVIWRSRKISLAVEKPVPAGKVRKVSFWGWPEERLSWTFPGHEGKGLKVNVYSRAPKVRLYLNNQLIAEKETGELYTASFVVPYQAGELKAVEARQGQEGAVAVLKTSGPPVALRLTADRAKLAADGQDLSFVLIELIDQQGNVVYDSNRKVAISLEGKGGKIITSGSASPNDMESFGSLTPKLFNGRAMAIIRADYQSGKMEVRVSSEGVNGSAIRLQSK
ncbi:beta-galactosidase [Hymenobacter cavernae]|uniref:Beta-galactosidase n=1 Tax=Hymenobacter cavernae TaxID=2044852 RepID=A0ABQ1UYX6_9BACT|nr:beta-galactosidase [Hymenobacter cavernae]